MTDRDHSESITATSGVEEMRGWPTRRCAVASTRTSPNSSDATQQEAASSSQSAMDELCINTIRTLSMDAGQRANSGHPGTPMAMAPVIYTLWQSFLRFDSEDPIWPNRDRFVLSAGHA